MSECNTSGRQRRRVWTQLPSPPSKPAMPRDMAAVLAFAEACVAAPRVPDDVFDAAGAALSQRDLVTVILLVGHYLMVDRLLATLDVELDPAPDNWAAEH